MKFRARLDDRTIDFTVTTAAEGFRVEIDGKTQDIDCVRLSPFSYSLIIDGASHYLSLTAKNGSYRVTLDQHSFCVQLQDETQILLEKFGLNKSAAHALNALVAPIPGLVKEVFVQPGDRVECNDKLLILEAMKMENEILSAVSGTVSAVLVAPGDSRNKGDLLLQIQGD